jgi:hypothetical protein
MEQLAQLGAASAGAYAVHEKHKAKKDPEHKVLGLRARAATQ